MIKMSVMYPNKPGARFDQAYYLDKHMPMVMGDIPNYTDQAPLVQISEVLVDKG